MVCLINPAKLQVEFTIPETNIAYVTSHGSIFVEFDAYKGKLFQAKVKSMWKHRKTVPEFLYSFILMTPNFDLKKYKVSVGFSAVW